MQRGIVLVGVGLLLLGVIGVQIADPHLRSITSPTVNYSDPPPNVTANSSARFSNLNYSYELDYKSSNHSKWQIFEKVRIDRFHRIYRATGPLGENGTTIIGTDAVTFARKHPNTPWKVGHVRDTTYPAPFITQPFTLDEGMQYHIETQEENSSFVKYQIQGNVLKLIKRHQATSSLYISKKSGLIEKAIVVYEVPHNQTRYMMFKLLETGTSVNRPDDLRFSLRELVWDILRGPLFSV